MEFEWDAAKELANIKKHKIPFADAVETFFDPNGLQMMDQKHSEKEDRFYWIGKTNPGRVLTTWFTRRRNTVHIIGCAEWRKFRRLYNETTKTQ